MFTISSEEVGRKTNHQFVRQRATDLMITHAVHRIDETIFCNCFELQFCKGNNIASSMLVLSFPLSPGDFVEDLETLM